MKTTCISHRRTNANEELNKNESGGPHRSMFPVHTATHSGSFQLWFTSACAVDYLFIWSFIYATLRDTLFQLPLAQFLSLNIENSMKCHYDNDTLHSPELGKFNFDHPVDIYKLIIFLLGIDTFTSDSYLIIIGWQRKYTNQDTRYVLLKYSCQNCQNRHFGNKVDVSIYSCTL